MVQNTSWKKSRNLAILLTILMMGSSCSLIPTKQIEVTAKPMDRTIVQPVMPREIALKDAKKSVEDINAIILVGGQTRMPKVKNIVHNFFGKVPKQDVNPDEAVAYGAAI